MRKVEIQSWEELVAVETALGDDRDEPMLDELLPEDALFDSAFAECRCRGSEPHHRWELDPASAEDYRERTRTPQGNAMRWRHFGH